MLEMVRKPSHNASTRKTYINLKNVNQPHKWHLLQMRSLFHLKNQILTHWLNALHALGVALSSIFHALTIVKVITLQSLLMVIYVFKLPCRYCHLRNFECSFEIVWDGWSDWLRFEMRFDGQVETAIKLSKTQNAIKCSFERITLLNMDFMDYRLRSFHTLNGRRFIALFGLLRLILFNVFFHQNNSPWIERHANRN